MEEKLEAVVAEREAKGMKEIAIQEKDLTLQWRGNTGKLVKVRLKIHVQWKCGTTNKLPKKTFKRSPR